MIKKALFCSMMVLGILGFAQKGQSAQNPGEFFITPMIGGHIFEGNQDPFGYDEELEHGLMLGLGIGYQLTSKYAAELMINVTDTIGDPYDVDIDAYPVHLDMLYSLKSFNKIDPYIAAGLGFVAFDARSVDTETVFMVNYGVGANYNITDRIALRADIRHLISFDDIQNNLLYSFGCVIGFGGEKEATPAKSVKKTEEVDSDNDGVYDSSDKCPNTASGVKVDNQGCPIDSDKDGVSDDKDNCADTPEGVKVDDHGCPVDSDNDGVIDDKDKCPGTPAGVKVDEDGCKVPEKVEVSVVKDSDNDGVEDKNDRCQGTPVGAKVDSRGCWVIKGLLFASGKSTIIPSTKKNVDDVVTVMKKNPDIKIEIQGYTDSKGSVASNLKLSDRRAKSVMAYIVSQGINKKRLVAKGYGIENPVASNDTEEGRSANRRVEIKPIP